VGGPSYEESRSVVASPDSGYVATGWTSSYGKGGEDAFAVKVNQNGGVEWESTFGGLNADYAYSVERVSTGGYIIAGRTRSSELTDKHEAMYVVRLSEQGELVWEKSFGDRQASGARYAEETDDGGFIIAGWTARVRHGNSSNTYVIKTDAGGNVEWEREYKRSFWDGAHEIHQTSDGGFIIAGLARPRRRADMSGYMMKLDESGVVEWVRVAGTKRGWDEFYAVEETTDGDFVFSGGTRRRVGGADKMRTWIVKTTGDGSILWNRWYGGGYGYAWGSVLSADGGVAVVGRSSNGANVAFLKVDSAGRKEWGMKLGSLESRQSYFDGGRSVTLASDGGFVLSGYIGHERGQKPHSNFQWHWDCDFWFVKLQIESV
jgi:hypothetical protein